MRFIRKWKRKKWKAKIMMHIRLPEKGSTMLTHSYYDVPYLHINALSSLSKPVATSTQVNLWWGGCHHVILQTSSYEEIHPVFWRKINFDNYINISCPLFFYLMIWTEIRKDRLQQVWCDAVKLNPSGVN